MAQLPSELITHARKVCSLYKRALRELENHYCRRDEYRYHAVLMRDRFDKKKNIADARVAKQLLLDGEEELYKKGHPIPRKFPRSPGGSAYDRVAILPDSLVDEWDPMEKAHYPKYFAQREQLKKEYIELYNKLYQQTPDKK